MRAGSLAPWRARWIYWKPSNPLLVHTGELILVRQNDRCTDNLVQ